ncbi:DUF2726 domain-containing protein [Blastococcus sp. SYSU DS0541]
MQLKKFCPDTETRTRRVLSRVVEGTLFWINVHTRLEDVIEPGPDDDAADRRFLRDAHFDFTIHKQTRAEALWAFEFDGPQHQTAEQRRRDTQKNRICLLAGLPLLRIDDRHLNVNEKEAVLDWHVRRWLAYEKVMPGLLDDRDREIAEMTEEEIADAGIWLLADRPHLDVEMLFELDNPYQPTIDIARRLLHQYGIYATEVLGRDELTSNVDYLARFDFLGALSDSGRLSASFARWVCPFRVERFDGYLTSTSRQPHVELRSNGVWESRVAYPVHDGHGPLPDALARSGWAAMTTFLQGPDAWDWMPAGPAGGGAAEVGKALAEYNALREVELWAQRSLRPRRTG